MHSELRFYGTHNLHRMFLQSRMGTQFRETKNSSQASLAMREPIQNFNYPKSLSSPDFLPCHKKQEPLKATRLSLTRSAFLSEWH